MEIIKMSIRDNFYKIHINFNNLVDYYKDNLVDKIEIREYKDMPVNAYNYEFINSRCKMYYLWSYSFVKERDIINTFLIGRVVDLEGSDNYFLVKNFEFYRENEWEVKILSCEDFNLRNLVGAKRLVCSLMREKMGYSYRYNI